MLSWKPKSRGAIYCSPACGCDCTYASFKKANSDAAKLAKRMGRGYKPYVWENMGWHFKVYNGKIEVYPRSFTGGFIVFIQTHPQFIVGGNNPKLLVKQALAEFDAHLSALKKSRAEMD